MNHTLPPLMALAGLLLPLSCGFHGSAPQASVEAGLVSVSPAGTEEFQPGRMLVWKAALTLQVWDLPEAVKAAGALAEAHAGYIEQKVDRGEKSARLTIRVPVKSFQAAVAALEALGSVTERTVEGEDVTEKYVDIEARLKNRVALRDRLHQLLEKAVDVKDILAIEAELNRVQADIDSMQGRLGALKGQVDYATIRLQLERRRILGPVGYVFQGIWWVVEKLFVIRR